MHRSRCDRPRAATAAVPLPPGLDLFVGGSRASMVAPAWRGPTAAPASARRHRATGDAP